MSNVKSESSMTGKEKRILAAIIILLMVATVLVGTMKKDYHVDEIWTFGLANHLGGIYPDIEYGKEYSGIDGFASFMEATDGNAFNYVNVWKNQSKDVHPPLYYFFIHTVCSLFKNSFSMWYGVIVNLLWLVPIIIMLYKLAKDITGSDKMSMGIVLAYGTSLVFFYTILFIRMYAQFTFFAIAIAYLFKLYWEKTIDRQFVLIFSCIAIFGMLTHYYFLIYTFSISMAFAVHLFLGKRFKELRTCIITAICDAVIYLLLWPHIVSHVFRGGRGQQALHSAVAIGLGDIMSLLIVIALVLVYVKKHNDDKYGFVYALALSGGFYSVVVNKIAPFMALRYFMPVLYIVFLTAFLILMILLNRVLKRSNSEFIAAAVIVVLNIFMIINYGIYTRGYSTEEAEFAENYIKENDCIVYVKEDWEPLQYFVKLQQAGSYTFINEADENLLDSHNGKYLLITQEEYSEDLPEKYRGEKIYEAGGKCFYLVN